MNEIKEDQKDEDKVNSINIINDKVVVNQLQYPNNMSYQQELIQPEQQSKQALVDINIAEEDNQIKQQEQQKQDNINNNKEIQSINKKNELNVQKSEKKGFLGWLSSSNSTKKNSNPNQKKTLQKEQENQQNIQLVSPSSLNNSQIQLTQQSINQINLEFAKKLVMVDISQKINEIQGDNNDNFYLGTPSIEELKEGDIQKKNRINNIKYFLEKLNIFQNIDEVKFQKDAEILEKIQTNQIQSKDENKNVQKVQINDYQWQTKILQKLLLFSIILAVLSLINIYISNSYDIKLILLFVTYPIIGFFYSMCFILVYKKIISSMNRIDSAVTIQKAKTIISTKLSNDQNNKINYFTNIITILLVGGICFNIITGVIIEQGILPSIFDTYKLSSESDVKNYLLIETIIRSLWLFLPPLFNHVVLTLYINAKKKSIDEIENDDGQNQKSHKVYNQFKLDIEELEVKISKLLHAHLKTFIGQQQQIQQIQKSVQADSVQNEQNNNRPVSEQLNNNSCNDQQQFDHNDNVLNNNILENNEIKNNQFINNKSIDDNNKKLNKVDLSNTDYYQKQINQFWSKINSKDSSNLIKNFYVVILFQFITILLSLILTSQIVVDDSEVGFFFIWIIYFLIIWIAIAFFIIRIFRRGKEINTSTLKFIFFLQNIVALRIIYYFLKNESIHIAAVFSGLKSIIMAAVFVGYPYLLYYLQQLQYKKKQGSQLQKSNISKLSIQGRHKQNYTNIVQMNEQFFKIYAQDLFEVHLLYCKSLIGFIIADLSSIISFIIISQLIVNDSLDNLSNVLLRYQDQGELNNIIIIVLIEIVIDIAILIFAINFFKTYSAYCQLNEIRKFSFISYLNDFINEHKYIGLFSYLFIWQFVLHLLNNVVK